MRRRWWLALGLAACGPAPGLLEAPPRKAAVQEAASGVATSGVFPEVGPDAVAVPSGEAEKAEDPCERARRWRQRATGLSAEGWIRRPLKLLAHARAACAKGHDAAFAQRLEDALRAAGDAAVIERQMEAAWQQGDARTARGLSARWVSRMQASAGGAPAILHRPDGRVLGADGSLVIVARDSRDRNRSTTIVLLDAQSGKPAYLFEPGAWVEHAEVAGDRLLTVEGDAVRLWSLRTGKEQQRLSWTGERYAWAGFTGAGKRVVAVGEGRAGAAVRVFDAASGDNVASVSPAGVHGLAMARWIDGTRLLAASREAVVTIDVAGRTASLLETTSEPRKPSIHSLATSPGGALAAITDGGTVLVWKGGTAPATRIDTGMARARIAFTAGGTRVLVASSFASSGELRTYEVASGKALRSRPLGGDLGWLSADGERVLVSMRRAGVQLQDRDGKAQWPARAAVDEIRAVALSRGLALSREMRTDESRVQVAAWYRDQVRTFEAPGYRSEVLAISPSGRRVAAVVARETMVWDLQNGEALQLEGAKASGFPDALVFAGESTLRVMHERPATTHRAALPFSGWTGELSPRRGLDGFHGTALSVDGAAVAKDSGAITLAPDRVLVPSGGGGFAFSQDGRVLFVGAPSAIAWYTPEGRELGRVGVPCTPGSIGVDFEGKLAAFECNRGLMTLRPPDALEPIDLGGEAVYDAAVHVSPSGHLIAVHERASLRLFDAKTRTLRATLTLVGGAPLLTAPDGRLMYWADSPPGHETAGCRWGHRVYPFEACQDALIDDAMFEALLAG